MAVVIFGWTGIGQTQGFSVLLLPLTAHVGVSERDISLVFLVGAFGGAFLMPVVGRILDARGARRLLIVATVCYAIAFCLLALVPVKAIALGSLLVVRLIGSIVLWLGASVLVAWWFSRHRGLALGLLLGAGSGLLALLVYGLSITIGELGFAPSFLLLAVTACAMLIPMLIWGVVDQPSELGQHPDGDPGHAQADASSPPFDDRDGVTAQVAFRTGYAWMLTAGGALVAVITTGYLFHEAVIFIEQGATAADAALSLLPQMLGNAGAILVVSALVDRFRMRWIVVVSLVQAVFTLWWGFHLATLDALWLFGVCFGVATGMYFGYALAALPKYFGTKHIGEIRGIFGAVTMAAAAFGPIAFEMLHEERLPLLLGTTVALAMVVGVASLWVRWPSALPSPRAATSLAPLPGPAGTGS